MMTNSKERNDWIEQAKREVVFDNKNADKATSEVMFLYDECAMQIEDSIHALYAKFAKDNNLSLTEANKLLTDKEYSIWRKSIEEYLADIKNNPADSKTLLELNTLAMKSRVSRKEQLLSNVYMQMAALANDTTTKMTDLLSDVVKVNYYRQAFTTQKQLGVAFGVPKLDTEQIRKILDYPWGTKKFSATIWDNVDTLTAVTKRAIARGVVNGYSSTKIAKEIDDTMQKGKLVAERVARTESHYFAYQARLESFKACGIKRYRFVGTDDGSGKCDCHRLNTKTFAVDEAVVGVNYPPIHPNCKCSVVASFEKVDLPKDAKPIDKDIKFADWQDKYIKDTPQGDINLEPLPIKKQSIKAVKPVDSSILDKRQQKQLAEKHKQLLEYVKDDPVGTEAIAYYDMNLKELAKYKGKIGHVDGRLVVGEHIAIHNHPSGNIFTHTDIRRFIETPDLMLLSAVGNNGKVYTIEKTKDFDGFSASAKVIKIIEKFDSCKYNSVDEYLEDMERLLKEADGFGAKVNR